MSKSMDKGVSHQNKKKMTAAEKWEKIKAKKAAKAATSSGIGTGI